MSLTEKYRPRTLAQVVGQVAAVAALQAFVKRPMSGAFIFSGDTGTGKTSAAYALAADLGCDLKWSVDSIASGEQTADAVRELSKKLCNIPMYGSGWRAVIVNEADQMSKQAETVWLDVLESLPPCCVVIFTTNAAAKMSSRFRDRCMHLEFASDRASLEDAAIELAKVVWEGETGNPGYPPMKYLVGAVEDERVSFRRVVQLIGKAILTLQPMPVMPAVQSALF